MKHRSSDDHPISGRINDLLQGKDPDFKLLAKQEKRTILAGTEDNPAKILDLVRAVGWAEGEQSIAIEAMMLLASEAVAQEYVSAKPAEIEPSKAWVLGELARYRLLCDQPARDAGRGPDCGASR